MKRRAPDPERAAFERWAVKNGYPVNKVPGGECLNGLPVYADTRTHAAWWAWQEARLGQSVNLDEQR